MTDALPRLAYLSLEAPIPGQGSYAHVHEIVAGLRRLGWNVTLFQPSYSGQARKPGILGRLLAYVKLQARLLMARRTREVIYVRGHFMALPTALFARLAHVPIVHEINGLYEDIFITYPWLRRLRRPLEAMQRLQYRWADRLLPVSEGMAEWLRAESGHDRITVIGNAANTGLFRPDADGPDDAPQQPYVIFVGSLARWHGVDTMLQAAAHDFWPADMQLVIVGAGQESGRVAAAAQANPRVIALGRKPYDVVPGLIAHAVAGLIPTNDPTGRARAGLSPLKLFETLACGVPAVVTDLANQSDLVREGRCGLVVRRDDAAALAKAVAALAADPIAAREMGRRGRALIEEGHSWDRRAQEVSRVLSELLRLRVNSRHRDSNPTARQ